MTTLLFICSVIGFQINQKVSFVNLLFLFDVISFILPSSVIIGNHILVFKKAKTLHSGGSNFDQDKNSYSSFIGLDRFTALPSSSPSSKNR